jgi:hypothetical protein
VLQSMVVKSKEYDALFKDYESKDVEIHKLQNEIKLAVNRYTRLEAMMQSSSQPTVTTANATVNSIMSNLGSSSKGPSPQSHQLTDISAAKKTLEDLESKLAATEKELKVLKFTSTISNFQTSAPMTLMAVASTEALNSTRAQINYWRHIASCKTLHSLVALPEIKYDDGRVYKLKSCNGNVNTTTNSNGNFQENYANNEALIDLIFNSASLVKSNRRIFSSI